MRICVDLDGVICHLRAPGQAYAELAPVDDAVATLRSLRAAGHTIIIHTARHMKTCAGNVGQVMARVGPMTIDWLARHGVEYDELYFGKPWADVYIDDNALRFTTWAAIGLHGEHLPGSAETASPLAQARTRTD